MYPSPVSTLRPMLTHYRMKLAHVDIQQQHTVYRFMVVNYCTLRGSLAED